MIKPDVADLPTGRDLFVISGISASGKTTVGRLLADRLTPSVFIEGDVIRTMVRNGRQEMTAARDPEAVAQLLLRYRHSRELAESYLREGFHVVAEDVILADNLAPFVAALRHLPVFLVVLNPSAEAVGRREAGRDKRAYNDRFTVEQLYAILRDETPRLGLWLDTSDLTAEETVGEILRRRDEALLPPVDRGRGAVERAAVERQVRAALGARVGAELAQSVPGGTRFEEVGIDSMDIVVVLAELERAGGGTDLTQGDLDEVAHSVDALVSYLGTHRA